MLPWLLCLALAAAGLYLGVRLRLLQKALDEIAAGLGERLAADTNNPLFLSSRDAHARRLAAALNGQLKELRRLRQRYENGDRALKKAVTGVAHDLRTPLTALLGYLELLEAQPQSAQGRRYLAVARERAERLQQLTEELFDYSVLLVPAAPAPPKAVCLNDLLENSLAAFYGAFGEKGIVPVVEMPPDKVWRTLDAGTLARVLENLLSNACKYSGGDLTVRLSAQGEMQFSNAAPGLTPVQLGRLFDRFYTVEGFSSSSGLGLSVARTLTERLGGSLTASLQAGRLTLCLQLPTGEAAPPEKGD